MRPTEVLAFVAVAVFGGLIAIESTLGAVWTVVVLAAAWWWFVGSRRDEP